MMRYAVVSSGLGNTIVDTAPTTLRGVIALTAGTAAFTIYDDTADPPTGQKLYASPATVALGFLPGWTDIPCMNGIVVHNVLLGAELLVIYD